MSRLFQRYSRWLLTIYSRQDRTAGLADSLARNVAIDGAMPHCHAASKSRSNCFQLDRSVAWACSASSSADSARWLKAHRGKLPAALRVCCFGESSGYRSAEGSMRARPSGVHFFKSGRAAAEVGEKTTHQCDASCSVYNETAMPPVCEIGWRRTSNRRGCAANQFFSDRR
jgi:hypothetical protein